MKRDYQLSISRNWKEVYPEISRKFIHELFEKYKYYMMLTKQLETDAQNIPSSFNLDELAAKSNYNDGQVQFKITEKKADIDNFLKEMDNVLRALPAMFREIIIKYYINRRRDIEIYIELGLPKSSYYYLKNCAILAFLDEYFANDLLKRL